MTDVHMWRLIASGSVYNQTDRVSQGQELWSRSERLVTRVPWAWNTGVYNGGKAINIKFHGQEVEAEEPIRCFKNQGSRGRQHSLGRRI